MANAVTNEEKELMNELYYQYKSYAEVARQLAAWGIKRTAATISKYIDHNFIPKECRHIIKFDINQLPQIIDLSIFDGVDNYGDLCRLNNEEVEEVKQLWGELSI